MPDQQTTYTQVVDEKTGEIKYVPNNPPTPPEGTPGNGDAEDSGDSPDLEKELMRAMNVINDGIGGFAIDEKLAAVLQALEDNNKKLRHDKRLQSGKLDGRRLTAYKTSDRLFKKKAIKHKDYRFTILLDTSGSMFDADGDGNHETEEDIWRESKLRVAVESISKVVLALEKLKIPVAVIGMNQEVRLIKGYDEEFSAANYSKNLLRNVAGKRHNDHNCGGTSEKVAYIEALRYMRANSHPKQENIAFVLSDGAPGTGWNDTPVIMEDGIERNVNLDRFESRDNVALKQFWEEQRDVTPYGIGIMSDASQIPNSKRLNKVAELPEFMNNLMQDLLL